MRSGLVVAGRTDAGVHATAQCAHLDVDSESLGGRAVRWASRGGCAAMLAPDVRVRAVTVAPPGFDARFSALRRHYRYRVCDHPAGPDPLRRHDTLAHPRPLDLAAMDAASARLLGLQDFAAFCRRREGATTVRTLLGVPSGRASPTGRWWPRSAPTRSATPWCAHSSAPCCPWATAGPHRASRRRSCAARLRDPRVTVAAAHGLTLVGVDYPDDDALATRAREARARAGTDWRQLSLTLRCRQGHS